MTRRKDHKQRWLYLDAVALFWWTVGVAGALGSIVFLGGWSGAWWLDWLVAQAVVEALGWAALVWWIGWAMVGVRLVLHRRWLRVGSALSGWTLLTAVAAPLADAHLGFLPQATLAGAGGTVGAYLRFQIEEMSGGDLLTVHLTVAGLALLGFLLAADRWLRYLLRLLWSLSRAALRLLLWVNERLADLNEWLVLRLAEYGRRWWARWFHSGHNSCSPVAASGPVSPDEALPFAMECDTEAPPLGEPGPIPVHGSVPPPTSADPAPVPPPSATVNASSDYPYPPLSLLRDPDGFPVEEQEQRLREVAALLEKTCQDFGIHLKVVGIHTGPVITQYEVALETGLRLNKVTALADDLALNLKVPAVRVVAPLPGRNTVGIEVPNEIRQTVRLKEVVSALASTPKVSRYKLPIFLGKDVEGRPLAYDLAAMPHLLIAGRTGTGKSVCLNTIIVSLLLTRAPRDCRLILIDPKKVELSAYARIPHLLTPVVTDEKKAEAILAWAVEKMEERYEWLHRARVRNIAAFNELGEEEILQRVQPADEEERRTLPRHMPYIVIIIDEVADLILRMKKEIEGNIILLAQKSRAAGIHLVLATQKPTVDVVTGLIKSNLPARICFQVASRSDSAVVLDEKGAERLLGHGDMLFLQPGTSTIIRAQGALIEDQEIERVVQHIATDTPDYDAELLQLRVREARDGSEPSENGLRPRERDPLYEQAVEIVVREQRGSTSLLQRALGIGYGKAARFIDYMAEDGIVGPYNGSNARQVLISYEQWQAMRQTATAD
ncbi:MAG: DNA translocase FtsK [Gemmataceae bacterium]|nr:DNA translocase FtsK [Gemmataceae bacterium]